MSSSTLLSTKQNLRKCTKHPTKVQIETLDSLGIYINIQGRNSHIGFLESIKLREYLLKHSESYLMTTLYSQQLELYMLSNRPQQTSFIQVTRKVVRLTMLAFSSRLNTYSRLKHQFRKLNSLLIRYNTFVEKFLDE